MDTNSIIDSLVEEAKVYQEKKPFPEIGDWHSSNAVAFYGYDKIYNAYKNDKYTFKNIFRSNAKSLGLALCYGGGWTVVQRALGVSEQEAKTMYESFFSTLSGFSKHLKGEIDKAKKTLRVRNTFGRVIHIPQLNKENEFRVQAAGIRNVHNYPIQSVSCDLIKLILNDIFTLVEKAETDRYAGDLINNDYYQRIAVVSEKVANEIEDDLEFMETGNVLLLVENEQGEIVGEFDRPLKMSLEFMQENNIRLEF